MAATLVVTTTLVVLTLVVVTTTVVTTMVVVFAPRSMPLWHCRLTVMTRTSIHPAFGAAAFRLTLVGQPTKNDNLCAMAWAQTGRLCEHLV